MTHADSPDTATEIVTAAIHAQAHSPRERLLPDTQLLADLGIDSLDFIALVQEIEDGLGFKLSDAQVAEAATVGDLVGAVAAALRTGGA